VNISDAGVLPKKQQDYVLLVSSERLHMVILFVGLAAKNIKRIVNNTTIGA